MALSHSFVAVAFAFHAELFEPGLLTRGRLLDLDLVLTFGHGRLCGVGRGTLFDVGVSRGRRTRAFRNRGGDLLKTPESGVVPYLNAGNFPNPHCGD